MRKRWVMAWTSILVLATLVACNRTGAHGNAGEGGLRPLNLVVVTVDTLRPDHLQCYGYGKIETPSIDSIAASGVLFENAVTQTPLTPPSHASIFTGLLPTTHHVRDTGGFVLQQSSITLATILQQKGWDTAAFVSSAVLKKLFGFSQGFAVYDDQMPTPGNHREFLEDPERRAQDTVDRAIHWLKGQSGKPYFLWVHLYDPHLPYQPPSPFKEKYTDRPYDGEIAYADRELGRLFDAVHKKSSADKTIIAVLSDHGESLGEHGEFSHGVFLYDATLRIAFLLSGADVPRGVRVKQQARTIDFLPTVLTIMGGRPPAAIQGISLTPSFSGGETATAVSYAETLYPKINMGWAELRAIRTNHWKYVRAPKPELYDLSLDPAETSNLIQTHSAEVQKFEAQLKAVAGAAGTEKVSTSLVDTRTLDQLKSLGYVSGFASSAYTLTGQGTDPKERIGILKLIAQAEDPDTRTPDSRRIQLLEQATQQDPANPDLYYQLGAKYEKAGRYQEATKLYYAALAKGIQNGRLHSRIADLLVRAGKKTEAIAEYEKAAQLDPSDTASQTNLAVAYLENGKVPDAERVFKWILSVDPASAAAYNGLGLVGIQRQDIPQARGYFEKAVQLDPDLLDAQLNLGLIYRMAGENAKARSCFELFLAKASPAQYGETILKVRDALEELR